MRGTGRVSRVLDGLLRRSGSENLLKHELGYGDARAGKFPEVRAGGVKDGDGGFHQWATGVCAGDFTHGDDSVFGQVENFTRPAFDRGGVFGVDGQRCFAGSGDEAVHGGDHASHLRT